MLIIVVLIFFLYFLGHLVYYCQIQLVQPQIRRSNGKIEKQIERQEKTNEKYINMIKEEFEKEFGKEGTDIFMIGRFRRVGVFCLKFHVKNFEEITPGKFSIIGDIVDVIKYALPQSLEKALIPKVKTNIVLVCNTVDGTIRFTRQSRELVMTPFDNESNSWGTLLSMANAYNTGYNRI